MAETKHEWVAKPIGYVESWYKTKNGTPRQGAVCPESKGIIRLNKQTFNNPHHALEGLEAYSNVW